MPTYQWHTIRTPWVKDVIYMDVYVAGKEEPYRGLMVGAFPKAIYMLDNVWFPIHDQPLPLIKIPGNGIEKITLHTNVPGMAFSAGLFSTFGIFTSLGFAATVPAISPSSGMLIGALAGALIVGPFMDGQFGGLIMKSRSYSLVSPEDFATISRALEQYNLAATEARASGFRSLPPADIQHTDSWTPALAQIPKLDGLFISPKIELWAKYEFRFRNTRKDVQEYLNLQGAILEQKSTPDPAYSAGLSYRISPTIGVGVAGAIWEPTATMASGTLVDPDISPYTLSIDTRQLSLYTKIDYHFIPRDRYYLHPFQATVSLGPGVEVMNTTLTSFRGTEPGALRQVQFREYIRPAIQGQVSLALTMLRRLQLNLSAGGALVSDANFQSLPTTPSIDFTTAIAIPDRPVRLSYFSLGLGITLLLF